MQPVNFVQGFGDSFVPGAISYRRDYEVLAIGDNLQRRVHIDVEDFQQRLVDYERGAVAVRRQGPGESSFLRLMESPEKSARSSSTAESTSS